MEHCSYGLPFSKGAKVDNVRFTPRRVVHAAKHFDYRFLLLNLISIEAVLVTRQHTQRVI